MEPNSPRKSHYQRILFRLFGDADLEFIDQILSSGKSLELETGQFLFHQGDTGNSLYIVLSGRFRALATQNDNVLHALGDIGEGEPIGEFALFTSAPRSASVVAIRKSVVLELTEVEYLKLVSKKPEFSTLMARFVINRMRRNSLQQHLESSAKNIAVMNLQADRDITAYTSAIQLEFEALNVPIQVLDHDSHASWDTHDLYRALEDHEGLNFLVCSEADLHWSQQCAIYADLIVIATDLYAESEL